jgi:hypothetical protein
MVNEIGFASREKRDKGVVSGPPVRFTLPNLCYATCAMRWRSSQTLQMLLIRVRT